MNKFNHVISLGFFCSVALEIDKLGLREASYPFDWLISDFQGIIECMENDFCDFLNYSNLKQYTNNGRYYYDSKYKFHFYHDFSKYVPLRKQITLVKEKYNRRITRFKNNIKEPTLFIRYIENKTELKYIENNYEYIIKLLKSFNNYNDLLLISNDDIISSNSLKIYKVVKDNNDTVARNFLMKNLYLKEYLLSDIYDLNHRNNNYKNYQNTEKKKKLVKYLKKIKNTYNKLFKKEYIHNKQINL